jgi:hypothetical protein
VRHVEDIPGGDAHVGKLTSRAFTIERAYVRFSLGGGAHAAKTCVNLLVDGAVVRTATGRNENRMRPAVFRVDDLAGKTARIEIVDAESGGWGNVGVDRIVFTDAPWSDEELAALPDRGSTCLWVLAGPGAVFGEKSIGGDGAIEREALAAVDGPPGADVKQRTMTGAVGRRFTLEPGASAEVVFVVAWHFPTPWRESFAFLTGAEKLRRAYAARFADALAVARHVDKHFGFLSDATRTWHREFYERSTLPHWFLERTMANTSTLATSTCYRFDDGRFYGWEGTYCCAGTCSHVWNYAQAVARLFPALERDTRERVDFGLAFHDDTGAIDYRAEAARSVAHDGQAGTIVRVWREHTMSVDSRFLRNVWPRVKRALEFLFTRDPNQDGILDGAQYNTLDAAWYGEIAWLSSVYLAAVRAGAAMAREMQDEEFARRCDELADRGSKAIVARLFDGEYFVQRVDPEHPEANATGAGCHIDQVLGQSWAHQVGLPRVLPEAETKSALRSLFKYSFAPDIGPYRKRFDDTIRGGRWYALPGEAGLLMCTWPKGGEARATGQGGEAWAAGYFNECMTGFEHQVAAHMLWEGLVLEGLAVTRAIHDRYHAARRNPWNEVECSDHYARAMASYGTYLAACGFRYVGPRHELAFVPRVRPEAFRAAFVAAESWGCLAQTCVDGKQTSRVELVTGKLLLRVLELELCDGARTGPISVATGGNGRIASTKLEGRKLTVTFQPRIIVFPEHPLEVTIG